MLPIKFEYLVAHLGEALAWQCLEEIEKASGIRSRGAMGDPEARLSQACQIQDMQIKAVMFISERQQRIS